MTLTITFPGIHDIGDQEYPTGIHILSSNVVVSPRLQQIERLVHLLLLVERRRRERREKREKKKKKKIKSGSIFMPESCRVMPELCLQNQ